MKEEAAKAEKVIFNKVDIAKSVAELQEITINTALNIVETVFGEIEEALSLGKEVRISKFGIFTRKEKATRMARNPKTGESVEVPAHGVIKFRASSNLKSIAKVI